MTVATISPYEEGTFKIDGVLYDSTSAVMAPYSLEWILTNNNQTVVNTGALTPAGSYQIVLTGNDLSVDSGDLAAKSERHLILSGQYTSSYGSNLKLKALLTFDILNLKFIT